VGVVAQRQQRARAEPGGVVEVAEVEAGGRSAVSRGSEGAGGWLVAGLGLVGLAGGGFALARSSRPARSEDVATPPAPAPAPQQAATATAVRQVTSQPAATRSKADPAAARSVPLPFRRWTGPVVPNLPSDAPRGPLTRSTVDRGAVRESAAVLLQQARAVARDSGVTLDELAGARLAASEYGYGSLVELAAVVDVELNRAAKAGRSLFDSLTRGAGFGRQGQGGPRPASTRLDPEYRHLWAARAVLVGMARGMARGAVAFFNPEAMDKTHAAWKAGRGSIPTSCDAMALLELWSFDRPRLGDSACPFDSSRVGIDTRAWVGPIVGVDPWRLLLMAPAKTGSEHFGAYVAARQVIEQGRARVGQKGNV